MSERRSAMAENGDEARRGVGLPALFPGKAVASVLFGVGGLVWLGCILNSPHMIHLLARRSHSESVIALALPWTVPILLGWLALMELPRGAVARVGRRVAKTGIVLGIAPILIGAAHWWAVQMKTHNLGGFVGRTRADMRSLATAIEAYYDDHRIYPAWGMGKGNPTGTVSYNWAVAASQDTVEPPAHLPTFLLNGDAPSRRFWTLTTPNPYIAVYIRDIFAKVPGSTFVYWSVFPGDRHPSVVTGAAETPVGGVGWILVSPGPDRDYDIAGDYDVYDPSVAQPSLRLLTGTNSRGSAFTYDPTNGVLSSGDVWRVKQ